MPIITRIDLANQVVVHEVSGKAYPEDYLAVLPDREADPDYRPEMNALWDLTASDSSALSSNDLHTVASELKSQERIFQSERIALVVASSVQLGMGRAWQMWAADFPFIIEIFEDKAAAMKWLTTGVLDSG